eukprot:3951740-Alexandrium_andersonii.AAC.1
MPKLVPDMTSVAAVMIESARAFIEHARDEVHSTDALQFAAGPWKAAWRKVLLVARNVDDAQKAAAEAPCWKARKAELDDEWGSASDEARKAKAEAI